MWPFTKTTQNSTPVVVVQHADIALPNTPHPREIIYKSLESSKGFRVKEKNEGKFFKTTAFRADRLLSAARASANRTARIQQLSTANESLEFYFGYINSVRHQAEQQVQRYMDPAHRNLPPAPLLPPTSTTVSVAASNTVGITVAAGSVVSTNTVNAAANT
jgi:hypothetical protein